VSELFVGIDAGTTRIKASLYDGSLHELASAARDVTVYTPGGGASEIDMLTLWGKLCQILQELKAADPARWRDVKGVGISAQGDGLWAVNAKGEPVRPHALIWNDTRTRGMNVGATPGLEALLKNECANMVYTGSQPALQKWLKIYEPDSYKSIKYSFHCKDWLNFKLSGVAASDYSDICCSSGMNIRTFSYIPEIYKILDIEEMLGTMPKPGPSAGIRGQVSAGAAEETGLAKGTPILGGCIDCDAVAAGTDFFSAGDACTIVGTALICEICQGFDDINADDLRGFLIPHVVKGNFIKMMATNNGTSNMDYMKNLLCPNEDFDALDAAMDQVPIGSKGLVFHPYLYGERSPFANPFAFASLFGLRSDHTAHELMRAAYEGMAMTYCDCYKGLKPRTMYLSGGATKSDFVCRLFCDCIGVPVKRQKIAELGALGIVKMLMVALKFADSFESLRSDSFTNYEPDMVKHRQYMDLYEKFVDYRKRIEDKWI
jgi:sugar (pentulose or hexulose) kinase